MIENIHHVFNGVKKVTFLAVKTLILPRSTPLVKTSWKFNTN
jgi:hypothetical protein